jgi:hypothetical protein
MNKAWGKINKNNSSSSASVRLTLIREVMCEGKQDFKPCNRVVVFSITIGKISCFECITP